MDDGNGSFCVKAYKKSSLPKVPTREQLHRNYIRSRQEEKIVAEQMPYFRAFSAFSVTATNFMNSITFVMNYLFLISSDFSDFASLSDPQTLPFFFKKVPPWFYLRRRILYPTELQRFICFT